MPRRLAPAPLQVLQLKKRCLNMPGPAEDEDVTAELRSLNPRKFYELCRVHIAFLIDVPCDFLEADADAASLSASPSCRKENRHHWSTRSLSRFFRRKSHGSSQGSSSSSSHSAKYIRPETARHLERLLTLLDNSSGLSSEGIFRRNGNSARLRELRLLHSDVSLPKPDMLVSDSSSYTVYDLSCALKNALTDLPEPLLTERFHHLFLQLADLSTPRTDEDGQEVPFREGDLPLLRGRQLRGFQLLGVLLPPTNLRLLRRLLKLLHRVTRIAQTRMTAESLGCIFGPLLLCPLSKINKLPKNAELNEVALSNRAVAFMIEHFDSLFELPSKFIQDVTNCLRKCREALAAGLSSPQSGPCTPLTAPRPDQTAGGSLSGGSSCGLTAGVSLTPDDSIKLSVAFATRSSESSNVGGEDTADEDVDTELEVARLYAAVSGLPESSRKKKLVKRFNTCNGGLTPGGGISRQSTRVRRRLVAPGGAAAGSVVSEPKLVFADSPSSSVLMEEEEELQEEVVVGHVRVTSL